MSRADRKKQAEKSDRRVGLVLTCVGLILIAALAGGAWWVTTIDDPIDAATNCPKSGVVSSVHIVMFDRSDPISGQQAQRIRQVLAEMKMSAVFGDRFDFYTFDGDTTRALAPILEICSPGRNANPL